MKYIIVDIDGTIANCSHRTHFLGSTPKDWDSFYEACDGDSPYKDMLKLVHELYCAEYNILFCTGRRENIRVKTLKWLKDNIVWFSIHNEQLLMRKDGDYRHDTVVKPEMLSNEGIMLQEIFLVLEDRNSMVKKWRELGLRCLQVADENF